MVLVSSDKVEAISRVNSGDFLALTLTLMMGMANSLAGRSLSGRRDVTALKWGAEREAP